MIAARRLQNQRLTAPRGKNPAETVAWFGAMQAQVYPLARWAIALRTAPRISDSAIAGAVDAGKILRTHVLRPTWHFVTPTDIGWMLDLTGPRIQRAMGPYYPRHGLDKGVLTRGTAIFERALGGGRQLTRAELGQQLQREGLSVRGTALALLTIYAECEQTICSGAFRGSQLTYAAFADRVPRPKRMKEEEALAELTRRYFRSHGPATARDFSWWSGLSVGDAKRGLHLIRAKAEIVDGLRYWSISDRRIPKPESPIPALLLPPYDEYTVAYRDREAVPHGLSSVNLGTIVINGQIAGTWTVGKTAIAIDALRPLTNNERRAVDQAVKVYEAWRAG